MRPVAELMEMAAKVDVWPDDDWETALVRGHHDEQHARELVAAERAWGGGDDQSIVDPWDRARVRKVYARCVPCHPNSCWDGGGHRFHVVMTTKPGRGAFKATEVVMPWERGASS